MKITFVGVGYVGLFSCYSAGLETWCNSNYNYRIKGWKTESIHQPHQDDEIERFLKEARDGKRKLNLHTTTDKESAYKNADLVL